MKAILMSIKPKWVEKIANGEKTVEVRKTVPKCGTPFKVYMYCTKEKYVEDLLHYCDDKTGVHYKANGKVVGEFVCDSIRPFEVQSPAYWYMMNKAILEQACLTKEELHDYIGAGKLAYGLHISDLKIYDKPRELSEFHYPCHINNCVKCKYLNRFSGKLECHNEIAPPPVSWCYAEELK